MFTLNWLVAPERTMTIVFAALADGRETATAGNERPGPHLITATLHRVNKQIVTGGDGGGAFGICEGTMQKDIEVSERPETQHKVRGTVCLAQGEIQEKCFQEDQESGLSWSYRLLPNGPGIPTNSPGAAKPCCARSIPSHTVV